MKTASTLYRAFIAIIATTLSLSSRGALPADYAGKPFADSTHSTEAQVIPGRVECAYFDLGGEGVAYHDTDPTNHGSGELNL